jgi:hypothetical protein
MTDKINIEVIERSSISANNIVMATVVERYLEATIVLSLLVVVIDVHTFHVCPILCLPSFKALKESSYGPMWVPLYGSCLPGVQV